MRFEPGKLYSLLDILGGHIECDGCKKQTAQTLTAEMARRENPDWQFGEKDFCPKCKTGSASAEFLNMARIGLKPGPEASAEEFTEALKEVPDEGRKEMKAKTRIMFCVARVKDGNILYVSERHRECRAWLGKLDPSWSLKRWNEAGTTVAKCRVTLLK